jgi:hypothetical protein
MEVSANAVPTVLILSIFETLMARTIGAEVMSVFANIKSSTSCILPGDA